MSAILRATTILLVCIFIIPFAARASEANPATLIHSGHYKQARPLLEHELQQNPNNPDALVLLARVHLAYNEYDDALKLLRQAVKQAPSNSDAHVYLAEAYAQKIDHAGAFEKIGMAKTIRKEAERAVAADPRNLDALESLMEFHIEAPGMVGGDKDKARELSMRIAELDSVRGNFARAAIAEHEKHYDEQKEFELNAVKSNPRSYDALVGASELYLSPRFLDYRAASEFAARAIAVDPTRVRGYSLLAQAYAGLGRREELGALLERAHDKVPDDLAPYFYAAQTLLSTEMDSALAEKLLRKYLTQQPEGEAPTLGEAHWRLGQALARQGKNEDAQREMEDAVRINPDLKGARKELERLKS
ncbi:MAG TPA: tetratricopeptide repeat protein [Candidatus Acidoferrales bacterium]|jgi:tetratricopeptide (TPR) repeat protein|nr:tetratricopeptide repeat protein [Candidatus Acidoferrales bacterium]